MVDDKRVVEDQGDVAQARCQYCGRTFNSPRGRSIHERACNEKEPTNSREDVVGEGVPEHVSSAVAPASGDEVVDIVEELTVPIPADQKGALKVDFRMPEASYVSDASAEIKQLISQMEEERKRWEEERKRFMEQTEALVIDEERFPSTETSEPPSLRELDIEDVKLFETKVARELDEMRDEFRKKADAEMMRELLEMKEDVATQLNYLDDNVATLTTVLSEFSARTLDDLAVLRKKLKVKADEGDLDSLKKKIRRMNTKLEGVVEEVGYQESLDLSKIPPGILELVYQTTLDDIARALNKTLGHSDAEKTILGVIEEVRLKTSGSELFRYESPRFKIKGVASSIEKGLISAKQAQMTYEELVKKMLEHIPRHTPKNFRALIKVKSQEFAVDRSSRLEKELRNMSQEFQSLRESLSEVSQNVSVEVSRLSSQLKGIKMELEKTISDSKVEVSVGASEPKDEDQSLSREERIVQARFQRGMNEHEADPTSQLEEEDDSGATSYNEIEGVVLSSIPEEGISFTKLKKELSPAFPGMDVQSVLDSLIQKGLTEKRPRGKGFIYYAKEEAEKEEGSGPENE
ncbi:MAG: hypothetical protein ACE5IO_04690 [Thermoplasmata archaeon]